MRKPRHRGMPDETTRFLTTLRGERGVHISCIDHGKSGKPYTCYMEYEDLTEGNPHITEIQRLNREEKYEVFFLVNAPNSKAGRFGGRSVSRDDVNEILAHIVDLDYHPPAGIGPEEKRPYIVDYKTKVWAEIEAIPLPPTVIVETKRGYQLYWRIQPGEGQSDQAMVTRFEGIQDALNQRFTHLGADKVIRNRNRYMRLPGFLHNKDKTDPYMVHMIRCEPDLVYTQDQLVSGFGLRDSAKLVRIPIFRDVSSQSLNFTVTDAHVGRLLNQCAFLAEFARNPAASTYPDWFGAGTVLTKLGDAGKELWREISQRDHDRYDEAEFEDYLERVESYSYSCKGLGCTKYQRFLQEKDKNGLVKPPCGVHRPLDLVIRDHEYQLHSQQFSQRAGLPEIGVEQAREILTEQVRAFIEAKKPGITLFSGLFGIGKSRIFVQEVVQAVQAKKYRSVLFLGPLHSQIHELYEIAEESGVKTIHMKGLEQFDGYRCPLSDRRKRWQDKGFRLNHAFCMKCSRSVQHDCDYLHQFSEAGRSTLVFGVHEHLMVLGIKPDLVVLDENFLKGAKISFTRSDITATIRLMQSVNAEFDPFLDEYNLLLAVIQQFEQAQSADDILSIFTDGVMEQFREFDQRYVDEVLDWCIHYEEDSPVRWFVLPDIVWLLRKAASAPSGAVSEVIRVMVEGDDFSYMVKPALPDDCPVAILDATGSVDFYQRALNRPVTLAGLDDHYIRQNSRIHLISGPKNVKADLIPGGTGNKNFRRQMEIIRRKIQEKGHQRVGIITFMQLEDQAQAMLKPAVIDHFGNLRGKNTFRDCDALFVLGLLRPPSDEIARLAHLVLGSGTEIEELKRLAALGYIGTESQLPLPMVDGSTSLENIVRRPFFDNEDLNLVYSTYVLGELLQAIGRARIYDDRSQDVYVMTTGESSGVIRYDSIITPPRMRDEEQRRQTFRAASEAQMITLIWDYAEAKVRAGYDPCGKQPPVRELLAIKKAHGYTLGRDKIYEFVKDQRFWPVRTPVTRTGS